MGSDKIVAVNIWFSSIEKICSGREKYLFRYLFSHIIENEITSRIEGIEKGESKFESIDHLIQLLVECQDE